jgi:hypothetical protein
MKQIPEEIKRGMELLDIEAPGWREKIDPALLDLGNCERCILGQIFERYTLGIFALELVHEEADRFGFNCEPIDYELLTQAWKEALSEPSSPVAAE